MIFMKWKSMQLIPKAVVHGGRRFSSYSSVFSQVESFPEFKLALEQESKGNFSLALPNLSRAKEVMDSTMGGPHTEHSAVVALHMAKVNCSMGKFKEALECLGDLKSYSDSQLKVHLHQMASVCHILESTNLHAALDVASEGARICESLQTSNGDDAYHLFSKNYSLQGISCLLLGQLTPAEEHFQLAGRWAEEPTDKLVSLSNIASLQCAVAYFQAPIYDGSSDTFPSKDQMTKSRELVKNSTLIQEGVDYWEEALSESVQASDVSDLEKIKSGAAAYSGTGIDQLSFTSTKQSDEKSENREIGGDAKSLKQKLEENIITDTSGCYTRAYATVLCNVAEAKIRLGDKASAAEKLSSALEALKISSQSQPNSEFFLSPVLGRALYLSGCDHYHGGNYVMAEGLFRSAIEKFQLNKYCETDPRHAYELMRVLHSYGLMLQKWEKREQEGEKMVNAAQAMSASIPTYPVHYKRSDDMSGMVHMTHMLLMLPF